MRVAGGRNSSCFPNPPPFPNHPSTPTPTTTPSPHPHTVLTLSGNSKLLTWVRLQRPQAQRYPDLPDHAGPIRVSVINPPNSDMCVRDHSYGCVYTRGLGPPTASLHNIFDFGKTVKKILALRTGFEPQVFGS